MSPGLGARPPAVKWDLCAEGQEVELQLQVPRRWRDIPVPAPRPEARRAGFCPSSSPGHRQSQSSRALGPARALPSEAASAQTRRRAGNMGVLPERCPGLTWWGRAHFLGPREGHS